MLTEHARDQASSYEKQQPDNKGGYPDIPVACGRFVARARKRGEVTTVGFGVSEKVHVPPGPRLKQEQETQRYSARVSASRARPFRPPTTCKSAHCASHPVDRLFVQTLRCRFMERKVLNWQMPARGQRSGKDDLCCCKVVSTNEVVKACLSLFSPPFTCSWGCIMESLSSAIS